MSAPGGRRARGEPPPLLPPREPLQTPPRRRVLIREHELRLRIVRGLAEIEFPVPQG